MSLSNDFKEFCEDELPMTDEEWEKWKNRLKEITKRLNRKYYSLDELEDEEIDNGLIVGSVGRTTAVRNVSDFDYIFSLPSEVYRRFDSYEGNGQSALLQEIKNELLKRYPNTKIKGDGQVVVIDFSDGGKIELVPAFEQSDGNFKYPDSRNGGSWKTTKPKPEIEKSKSLNSNFNNHFSNLTRLIRQWKNHMGFSFKGLLIDTLISDLIDEEIITFLPLEFLKTNRGTTKRRILERLQSHEVNTETKHALGKMTSWHVLEIIRVMFHSLEEAKKYGLGTRINPSTTSYKTFPLKTYSLEERNKIFNNTIKKNTKEKLEDKMLKLILKRLRDGIKI